MYGIATGHAYPYRKLRGNGFSTWCWFSQII